MLEFACPAFTCTIIEFLSISLDTSCSRLLLWGSSHSLRCIILCNLLIGMIRVLLQYETYIHALQRVIRTAKKWKYFFILWIILNSKRVLNEFMQMQVKPILQQYEHLFKQIIIYLLSNPLHNAIGARASSNDAVAGTGTSYKILSTFHIKPYYNNLRAFSSLLVPDCT